MALLMASSHSSRSDAELQREKKAGEAAKLPEQQADSPPPACYLADRIKERSTLTMFSSF